MGDFFYLEAEVALHVGNGILLNLQQGSDFSLVAVKGNRRVEHQYLVGLGVGKDSLLLVILHIGRHHHGVLNLDAAFLHVVVLVELGNQTFQHVAFGVLLYALVVSATLCVHFHLTLNQLVVYVDGIVVDFIVGVKHDVELRSQGNVEYKFESLVLCKVDGGLLLFIGKGLAQHVHLVIFQIFINLFLKHFVHFLSLDGSSILLLDQAHRNHTRTETRHVCLFAEVFQGLLNSCLVVFFFQFYRKQCAYLVNVL